MNINELFVYNNPYSRARFNWKISKYDDESAILFRSREDLWNDPYNDDLFIVLFMSREENISEMILIMTMYLLFNLLYLQVEKISEMILIMTMYLLFILLYLQVEKISEMNLIMTMIAIVFLFQSREDLWGI